MGKANKGGEVGVNGEFYKGGRFLPNNPDRAKVEGSAPRKARKIEIEPFNWVAAPAGFVALFGMLDQRAAYDRVANTFGAVDENYLRHTCRTMTATELETEERRVRTLVAAYNRGERIIMQLAA
jgi:hypothetical protein